MWAAEGMNCEDGEEVAGRKGNPEGLSQVLAILTQRAPSPSGFALLQTPRHKGRQGSGHDFSGQRGTPATASWSQGGGVCSHGHGRARYRGGREGLVTRFTRLPL